MRALMKSKLFQYFNILLIAALFAVGLPSQSYFVMASAVCAALFCMLQLRLFSIRNREEDEQKKKCKPIGYFMLLPTAGMLAVGVLLLFEDYLGAMPKQVYTAIALSGVLAVCMVLQTISVWKEASTAGRFTKQVLIAGLSAPVAVIVVLTLHIIDADGDMALSCMSTVLFAIVSLLLSANMILVSNCGYRGTADSIKIVRKLFKRHRLIFTRISIFKDAALVAGKAVISVISASFFMFVNVTYSVGMGIARFVALKMHTQNREKQIESYRLVGVIITIASVCYVLYSVRLFFGGKTGVYSMSVALVIALYTFVEFFINIRDAFRHRKIRVLEAKALKAISFSSTLLCFVLTQTAIMSFAAEGDNSFVNALSGVVFGGLAALRGIFVILDSLRHEELLST